MIRRPRKHAPIPTALDGPDSPGHKETQKAIDYYSAPDPADGAPKYKAYRHDKVKEALTAIFHGKCAYRESSHQSGFDMDVEHFRPKGGVLVEDEVQKPGYYWLAAKCTNLLPSCTHCNQNRRQRVHATDEVVTVGKMNQFPIANPTQRATRPGDEAHERRLLLNPCRDHPENTKGPRIHPRLRPQPQRPLRRTPQTPQTRRRRHRHARRPPRLLRRRGPARVPQPV